MKLLIVSICFLQGLVFADPVIDIYEKTSDFFISQDQIQSTDTELVDFIVNLREQIIELGYDAPSLEVLIQGLDEKSGLNGLSNKMMDLFYPKENIFFNGFYCLACSQNASDEYDYGNAAIGGCELLAAGLCAILPFGDWSQGVSLFFFGDGMRRIMNDVSEVGKLNGNNEWDNIKGSVYE